MVIRSTDEALSLQDIRQQNASKIFHTLRENPGIAQKELVDLTGIDQGTISVIVNALFEKNIVSRSKESQEGRVGRPRMALRLSKRAGLLLGASLEHNHIDLVATHLDGKIVARESAQYTSGLEEALKTLGQLIKRLLFSVGRSQKEVLGLGIAAPIIIEEDSQEILFSPTQTWAGVNLKNVAKHFDMPTYFANNANAAAMAEQRFGVCKNIENYFYIGAYSGLGSAIVIEGKLYKGARGFAGELGHSEVVPNGRICTCGHKGCLEAYISEKAMLERLSERGTKARNLADLMLLAKNGHQFANFMLFEAGMLLGKALTYVDKLLNPEYIVLAGALAQAAPFIKDELEFTLRSQSLKSLGFNPKIIVSSLAKDAVAMGGVVLVLEGFLSQPEWFS